MGVTVREATVDDAGSSGLVHVRSWQAAYAGIVPDDVLAALDPVQRAAGHRRRIADRDRPGVLLVAERDGAVVGFVEFGPYGLYGDGDGDETTGEVYAIYVHPDHWGQGAGRALMEAAVDRLGADGRRPVRLWVFDANEPTRRFYERCGFVADGATGTFPLDRPGGERVELPIVRYTLG
jgi:ribosomal protein S18 acetylase RimI-like enzyme